MNSKKIILIVFVLVALVQIYVPAKIILDRAIVLSSGKEFKFKTAPIDPSDPFRGKYINLTFNENTVEIQNKENWVHGETVFVLLSTDNNGFAKTKSVSKVRPVGDQDFLKVKVNYVAYDGSKLFVEYPFDRFYMEESKAYDAELTYNRTLRDTSQVTYALVNIKNGQSVLKDVLINGIPIREIVKQEQQNRK
jgi:uncharacterized membrane-anchored protein